MHFCTNTQKSQVKKFLQSENFKVEKIQEDSLDFVLKSLLTTPINVLPYYLKQTFPPIIWIFTQGEEDEIESKLSS